MSKQRLIIIWTIVFSMIWQSNSIAKETLDIYWIDVEGGAATLIVTPAGESILIDTGNPGIRDSNRVIKVCSEQAKIKQIDHLIITHYHGDHFGGAAMLSTLIPIKTVWDNGIFEKMVGKPGKEYFDFKCEQRKVIKIGQNFELIQQKGSLPLSLTCLAARQEFSDAPSDASENQAVCANFNAKDRDGSDNANSIVVRLNFGDFCFFDAGDLTWNMEKNLVCPKNIVGKVDVYQVTHHGLSSSNNPIVLQTLKPRVAIMNNGTKKGCAPEVYGNLIATKSIEAIYQMHKNLRPDGAENNTDDEYIANLVKECKGAHLHLSVAANTKTYTVHNPTKSHKKEYKTKIEK